MESAPEEYAKLIRCFWRWADFFIVNVSSPNTPELRKLQDAQAIDSVLSAIDEEVTACRAAHPSLPTRPIWVKVDPDLSNPELDALMEVCGRHKVQGIVATNTTTWRPQHHSDSTYSQTGGLSGAPLRERSSEVIRRIHQRSQGKLKIIGVGGIMTARDAWEKIGAGACLLQVYSGLVFKGPTLVKELVAGLSDQVGYHGLKSLDQAVGKSLPFLRRGKLEIQTCSFRAHDRPASVPNLGVNLILMALGRPSSRIPSSRIGCDRKDRRQYPHTQPTACRMKKHIFGGQATGSWLKLPHQ